MPKDDDFSEIERAADLIEKRLAPKPPPMRHVNWRDTELGTFEEESVRDLYRHAI